MRFLLFDRIVAVERGRSIRATKLVNLTDGCLPDHYPRQPIMPGSLLIEGLAQLGAMLNFVNHRFEVEMVLALLSGARLTGHVRPGDVVALQVHMLYDHPYGATMRGESWVGDAQVAAIDRMVYAHDTITDERTIRSNRERFAYHGGVLDGLAEPVR